MLGSLLNTCDSPIYCAVTGLNLLGLSEKGAPYDSVGTLVAFVNATDLGNLKGAGCVESVGTIGRAPKMHRVGCDGTADMEAPGYTSVDKAGSFDRRDCDRHPNMTVKYMVDDFTDVEHTYESMDCTVTGELKVTVLDLTS